MKSKNQGPQGQFRKLILHFNIDKTIVMRDSLTYNNTDYMVRQILSELIWGKPDKNKAGEEIFKPEHKGLEYDKSNVEPDLICYKDYLEEKYKPMTQEEFDALEDKDKEEKTLEDINKERNSAKIKAICDICEPGNPGVKFKRGLEDMRKKLRVDEKIQVDLGLKLDNTKLDEAILNEKDSPKFNELGEDYDRKDKFRKIFKNSYHKIIISFFSMMIALKKAKQDFAIVFRFFGHDEADIDEFIYEFNCFCECLHPRYCGDYGYNKVKYDVEKDKKDYRINKETEEFMGVSYRSTEEKNEKMFFGTLEHPTEQELEEHRENIDEFYLDNENESHAKLCNGYNEIYLTLMEKLTQNCSFVMLDDYSYYRQNGNKYGKLLLVDPYDVETLQIFFDTDTDEYPEKIEVIDVVTKKKLERSYVLNKFLVNVEPYRAILDINYFNNKIEECVNNRKSELLKMQGKETPLISLSKEFDYNKEIKKMPGGLYLQMTVMPLLHNALTMCDMIRPQDPISFIANFMIMNKGTVRSIEDLIKEMPQEYLDEWNKNSPPEEEEENHEEEQEEPKEEEPKEEQPKEEEKKEEEKPPEKDSKNSTQQKSRPGTKQSKTKGKK